MFFASHASAPNSENMTGTPELVFDDLEKIAGGDPAVDVGPEDIEPLALLRDEIDVLEVAVRDRDRPVRVERLDGVDDLAEKRIEIPRAGGLALAFGERFDLERGPRETVVVLVSEKPHEDAGRPAEPSDQRGDLVLERLAHARDRSSRPTDTRCRRACIRSGRPCG